MMETVIALPKSELLSALKRAALENQCRYSVLQMLAGRGNEELFNKFKDEFIHFSVEEEKLRQELLKQNFPGKIQRFAVDLEEDKLVIWEAEHE